MMNVPLTAVPSQIVNATLGGQSCTLKVYQRTTGLFIDIYVDDTLILGGALLRDRVLVLRDAYFGFVGDLMMIDTQATADPFFSASEPSVGSRFQLIYIETADFADLA
jgi:hypothetical protein